MLRHCEAGVLITPRRVGPNWVYGERAVVNRTIAAAAATAVTVATVATVAVAGSAHATTAHHRAHVGRYTVHVDETSGLNAQGVPGGLGHTGTVHAALSGHGKKAGAVELELVVTSVRYPSTILQTGTIQLLGGTLAVQGVEAENQQDGTLAVTGGTGRYVRAAGTATVDGATLTVRWQALRPA